MTRTRRTFPYPYAPWLLLVGLNGCSNLSPIQSNQCGNLVVESSAGEDCDGQAGCGAPGTDNACRYACDTSERSCPTNEGFQCGTDLVCRRPSGQLLPLESRSIVTTRDMLIGDINSDGCSEIVLSALRTTSLTAYSSTVSQTCVATQQALDSVRPDSAQTALPQPALLDLDPNDNNSYLSLITGTRSLYGDGLSLNFSNGSPSVFPVLFPRFRRPGSDVRSVTVELRGQQVLLLLEQAPGAAKGDVTLISDPQKKLQTVSGAFQGNVDDIEMMIAADVDFDPANPPATENKCDEVILLRRASRYLEIFNICMGPMSNGFVALPSVELVGSAARDKNVVIVAGDLNGDNCSDLLANANVEGVFVAYGTCKGKFQSVNGPPMPVPDQKAQPLGSTMAEEAEKMDHIFVLIEMDDMHAGREIYPVGCPSSAPFSSPRCAPVSAGCRAIVADIDDNGREDVIASEGQNVDIVVHRQVAAQTFNTSYLSTLCPPQQLGVGDFDSDGINDVAFFDQTSKGPQSNTTSLSVAFGNALAAPNQPASAGRFDKAQALSVVDLKLQGTGALLGITRNTGEDNSSSAVGFVEIGNERTAVAPYYMATEFMGQEALSPRTLVSSTAGLFGVDSAGKASGALAILSYVSSDMPELWLVDADDKAGSLRNVTKNVAADVPCTYGCMFAAYPQVNGRDKLFLLGDKLLVEYAAQDDGFAKSSSVPLQYSFTSLLDATYPPKYTPRPLVADVNGDGQTDIVALASSGELIALYGQSDGTFKEAMLVAAPSCSSTESCGNLSAAQLNIDSDAELELIVVGPGTLKVFDVDTSAQALLDVSSRNNNLLPIPSSTTDFTALGAADLDGDGVGDIALISSSNFLDVFRGRPEHE